MYLCFCCCKAGIQCSDLVSVLSIKHRELAVSSTQRCWPWLHCHLVAPSPVPPGPAQNPHPAGSDPWRKGEVLPFAEIKSCQSRSVCLVCVSFSFLCYIKLSVKSELLVFAPIPASGTKAGGLQGWGKGSQRMQLLGQGGIEALLHIQA